jgi:hypothetical protein
MVLYKGHNYMTLSLRSLDHRRDRCVWRVMFLYHGEAEYRELKECKRMTRLVVEQLLHQPLTALTLRQIIGVYQ